MSLEMHKKVLTEVKSDRDNYGDTCPSHCWLAATSEGHSQGRIAVHTTTVAHQWDLIVVILNAPAIARASWGMLGLPVFTVDCFHRCAKAAVVQVSRAPHPAGIWLRQPASLLILHC